MRIVSQLPPWQPGFSAWWVAHTLDGMARGYTPWAALNPLPPLYGGRIRYRMDPSHGSGTEVFNSPWVVAERGEGDCNDLVTYRLVELYLSGERPRAEPDHTRAEWQGGEIHVLIRRQNGELEDPSIILLKRAGQWPLKTANT
jgi:hypothetical protein